MSIRLNHLPLAARTVSAAALLAGTGALVMAIVDRGGSWMAGALFAVPAYLTYNTWQIGLGHLRDEQRHTREWSAPIARRPTRSATPDAASDLANAPEPAAARSTVPSHAGPVSAWPATSNSVDEDGDAVPREIYALYEIAQAMSSRLGVVDTMELIASKLSAIVPFSCCALFLRSAETDTLSCRFATGVEADAVRQLTIAGGQGPTGSIARSRQPLVNAQPSADFEAAGQRRDTTLLSALICPLTVDQRFIGTIAVYHTAAAAYTNEHRRLLSQISEQAAAVIDHSIVFEQTQEHSLSDPLTGLPNTRFLFMHLTRELARAGRLKSDVSLLVMDLDHFREINDTHGRGVGDRALREAAAVLRSAIRPYDICARYAGDEFIIALAGCGGEEAEKRRAALQSAVDDLRFQTEGGQTVALAISVGAAVFPDDGDSYEMLLAAADSRMYRDKVERKRQATGLVAMRA